MNKQASFFVLNICINWMAMSTNFSSQNVFEEQLKRNKLIDDVLHLLKAVAMHMQTWCFEERRSCFVGRVLCSKHLRY